MAPAEPQSTGSKTLAQIIEAQLLPGPNQLNQGLVTKPFHPAYPPGEQHQNQRAPGGKQVSAYHSYNGFTVDSRRSPSALATHGHQIHGHQRSVSDRLGYQRHHAKLDPQGRSLDKQRSEVSHTDGPILVGHDNSASVIRPRELSGVKTAPSKYGAGKDIRGAIPNFQLSTDQPTSGNGLVKTKFAKPFRHRRSSDEKSGHLATPVYQVSFLSMVNCVIANIFGNQNVTNLLLAGTVSRISSKGLTVDGTTIGKDSSLEGLNTLVLQMSQESAMQCLIHSGRYRAELMKVSGWLLNLVKSLLITL